MNTSTINLTEMGMRKLKNEYELLKKRYQKISHDLKENANEMRFDPINELKRFEQQFLQNNLDKLETLLKRAIIFNKSKASEKAELGATIEYSQDNKPYTVILVESVEASPSDGHISIDSPIGKALLGHRNGQDVIVTTPRGIKTLMITRIS